MLFILIHDEYRLFHPSSSSDILVARCRLCVCHHAGVACPRPSCVLKLALHSHLSTQVLPGGWTEQVANMCTSILDSALEESGGGFFTKDEDGGLHLSDPPLPGLKPGLSSANASKTSRFGRFAFDPR